jgi:hypothetical protein
VKVGVRRPYVLQAIDLEDDEQEEWLE